MYRSGRPSVALQTVSGYRYRKLSGTRSPSLLRKYSVVEAIFADGSIAMCSGRIRAIEEGDETNNRGITNIASRVSDPSQRKRWTASAIKRARHDVALDVRRKRKG